MQWQRRRLNELGTVARGRSRHRPRNASFLYGGPYPFFQTGDVKAAEFFLRESSQTYNEAGLAQSRLWPRGTLCITIAANIAETAILDVEGCFPDSVVGFIPDEAIADVRFVKYLIDALKIQIQSVSEGTTQSNLSLDKLLRVEFVVPSVLEQRRIADALAAFDLLIDNDRQQIRNLEEMARALYSDWFDPLPTSEDARTNQQIRRFADIAEILRDSFNPGTAPDEEFEHYSIPAFDAERRPVLNRGETIRSTKYLVDEPAVLLSKLNPRIARTWLAAPSGDHRAVASTEFLVLRPLEGFSLAYLYALCGSDEFRARFASLASGTSTSHQRVNPASLMGLPLALPDPTEVEPFTNTVAPMLDFAERLRASVHNLRATRDLLLPRMMSGQLELKDVA